MPDMLRTRKILYLEQPEPEITRGYSIRKERGPRYDSAPFLEKLGGIPSVTWIRELNSSVHVGLEIAAFNSRMSSVLGCERTGEVPSPERCSV